MTRKTCQICFGDYLSKNEKEHQCPDNFCCGACGEIADHTDGEMVLNAGFPEFVHKAELCAAQDELKAE